MKKKRIVVYGGSFNPPGMHHYYIVKMLAKYFDLVIVVPCGGRPDKPTIDDIEPIHRAIMTDMTFGGLPKVLVDLSDLEKAVFTRTKELDRKFRRQYPDAEIWHAVGTDVIKNGSQGKAFIQTGWKDGPRLWRNLNFVVMDRPGYKIGEADLPPHHWRLCPEHSGASMIIREKVLKRRHIQDLVVPRVKDYIERYNLYRGRYPGKRTDLSLGKPRILISVDADNPKAVSLAKKFEAMVDEQNPNLIVSIGGDGMMLHTIRQHWQKRLPFLGINAGHRGFLLNEPEEIVDLFYENLMVWQLPLLYVEATDIKGEKKNYLAFNDTWVNLATGQTAWLRVAVKSDGHIEGLRKMGSDGVLIGTAAGSTAYAKAMGATPILIGEQTLNLVGNNVSFAINRKGKTINWKSAKIPINSLVEIEVIDPKKRPVNGFVDGVPLGEIIKLTARVSHIAAAELAFVPGHDIAAKTLAAQFS